MKPISVTDILQAGIHTRSNTELWVEVVDAVTPTCEHSTHNINENTHGGEVHRLIRSGTVHTCSPAKDFYICDRWWNFALSNRLECVQCGHLIRVTDYIVLAEF